MNKILLLALANIRKTKAQTAILALLFLISSTLLNIGLMVYSNFGNFYDKTAEELHTSDAYYTIPQAMYNEEVEHYLSLNEDILSFEKNDGILGNAKLIWNGEERTQTVLFSDKNEVRSASKWKLVSEAFNESENAVYVPYPFKVSGGYALGDTLTMEINGVSYSFAIAGFSEDIFFSSTETGILSFYLLSERYSELSSELAEYRTALIFADVKQNYKAIETGLLNLTGASLVSDGSDVRSVIIGSDYSSVKQSRTMLATIAAIMVVVFSAVIVVVSLFVIRFRVGNSIEEDLPKIGSLKALGYTSSQISLTIATQYAIIAIGGSLFGILPAYFAMPWVSDVFALQSGLLWKQGFDPEVNLASVGALLLIVVIVILVAALKIRKINPVQALRGGIATHSFKKNRFSLEQSKIPLTMALSFKSVIQNMKQSVMIFIVLAAIAFTATFAIIMFYNSAINSRTFAEVPGIEISNAILVFSPGNDAEILKNEVADLKDVRKTQYLDDANLVVDGNDIRANVMNDYAGKETNTVYAGRYPIYDNEISISGAFSNMLKKGIGDTVLAGAAEVPYIVTGLTQGSGNGGTLKVQLTLDGMRKLVPDFKQMSLQVYLKDGVHAETFIEEIKGEYGERIVSAVDVDKSFEQGMGAFISIVSLVGTVMVIVAAFVVVLVLYFVIGSTIIRKRRELGIQKALGYTTWNLMNQVSLSFILPLVIGIAAGCLLGVATFNSIMSVNMSDMGVMKANYIIEPIWIVYTGVGLIVMSYMTSMLIAWRIRKISAYTLVTE